MKKFQIFTIIEKDHPCVAPRHPERSEGSLARALTRDSSASGFRTHGYKGAPCIQTRGALVVRKIEAKSTSSKKDFIKFYEIALKSANETKYWLGLLRDATEAGKIQITRLLAETNELSNMPGASLLTLKNKR